MVTPDWGEKPQDELAFMRDSNSTLIFNAEVTVWACLVPTCSGGRDRVYKRRGLDGVVNMVVFGVVDTTLNYVIQKFFFGSSVI